MAENQQAEIEILVGALGGYKIDGESGALIKQQLQAQLVKGVDIKIGIDQESKKAFRSFLKENVKVKLGLSQDAAKDLNQFLKKDYKLKVHIDDASKAELKKYIDKIMEAQGTAVKKATQQSSSKNPVMSNTSWQTTLRGYDAAIERANKLKLTNDDVVSAVEAVRQKMAALQQVKGTQQEYAAKQSYDEALASLDKLVNKQREMAAESSKSQRIQAQAALEQQRFNKYVEELDPQATKQYAVAIAEIQRLLTTATTGVGKFDEAWAQAQNAIKRFKASMKSVGAEGGNILTYLEGKVKTLFTYVMANKALTTVLNGLTKVKDAVLDLNEAMTQLQIITGYNNQEAEKLLMTYNGMAQNLGTTTTSVAEGAQDWLRQGYALNETNTLIRQSMAMSIMGNMEASEATESLTAALKGYKLEVSSASDVVDKFFAVDMAAATSSTKMALALAKCAANAKLAGISMDDLLGKLASTNEVLQESGEETGTFMNTLLSRMTNIKSGNLVDPESAESLSDVETVLQTLGIRLRDSRSEFRNLGDVLDEVASKWNSYTSVQQRSLAVAFSGTRQQTRFLAMMENYTKGQEYAEVAANSIGVSAQKMEIYQDSLLAKQNRVTAAFEKFSEVMLPDSLVGAFYDLESGALNLASALDGIPIKIVAIVTAASVLKSVLTDIKTTKPYKAIAETLTDLAKPKMTGFGINVAIIIEEPA